VLVCADYKNAELAIAAHMSNDENLCTALRSGTDPFILIARRLRRKICLQEVSEAEHARAKQDLYSVMYGGGSPELEKRFFECFPRVKELIASLQAQAHAKGVVYTVAGLKMAMVANDGLEARLQRSFAPGVRVRLLMQLHDELVYEVGPAALPTPRDPSDLASDPDPAGHVLRAAVASISAGMTGAGARVGLRVPLRTTVKVGATWGSARQLDLIAS
jgi:DNA polymerase I-like protein with 3'-5' exonuclease and polymerase domains